MESVVVFLLPWVGEWEGLPQSMCYLRKAGRTAGTLRLGARYRPLWLRSLQKRRESDKEESLLGVLFIICSKHDQFTQRASRNYKLSPAQLFFSHIKLKQRWNAAVFQIVLTPSGWHPLSHQNVCHISFPKLSRQGKETSVCSLFQRKDLKRSRKKTCVLYWKFNGFFFFETQVQTNRYPVLKMHKDRCWASANQSVKHNWNTLTNSNTPNSLQTQVVRCGLVMPTTGYMLEAWWCLPITCESPLADIWQMAANTPAASIAPL